MTERRPRVLVLSYTVTANEPRVRRQVDELRGRYEVTTAGYGAGIPGVAHIELDRSPAKRGPGRIVGIFALLLLLRLHLAYERLNAKNQAPYERLRGMSWDLVAAHDVETVGVALRLRPRIGVLADLHEFAGDQEEPSLRWRLLTGPYFRWVCRRHLPRCIGATTVSQGIVDAYRTRFGIEADFVINATAYQELSPSPVQQPLRLVHSGSSSPARRLDILIDAVKATTVPVTLDLLLVGQGSAGYQALVARADGHPRIRFRDPVPYDDLVATLNEYDAGLHLILPTSFNHVHALPNKLFDYLQARLGVVIGPSPEMVRVVSEVGYGEVLDDFEPATLASALDRLDPGVVAGWKRAADAGARLWSGEEQARVWGRQVDRVVAEHDARAAPPIA